MANWRKGYEKRTGKTITDAELAQAKDFARLRDTVAVAAAGLASVLGARNRLPRTLRRYVSSAVPGGPQENPMPWTSANGDSGVRRMDDRRPFLRMSRAARVAEMERVRADMVLVMGICRLLLNGSAEGARENDRKARIAAAAAPPWQAF